MTETEWIADRFKTQTVQKYQQVLKRKRGQLILKRIFDIIVSSILLVILLPLLIVLAIWIKIDSSGPVFYRQERVTTNGKLFRIFKFRTMVQNADKLGSLVTEDNDPRISHVGSILRDCRLDEIPQLINIFLGDMSFVGTRPEVRKYVESYTDEMVATLLLPAGVTSLASIMYKDEAQEISHYIEEGYTADEAYVSFILPKKMEYNLAYLEELSLWYDIKLMVKTVVAVIK